MSAVLPVPKAIVVLISSAFFSGAIFGQEAPAPATAEEGGGLGLVPKWRVEPRISLTEILTDNAVLGSTAAGSKNDQITQLSPGIRIDGRGARLKAYFDYSLTQIQYAQNGEKSRTQNALNTFGTLEAVEKWLFLDFRGSITQQTVSAFGAQSSSNASINANSTETSTYSLSPYIRGRLLGAADYLVRYQRSTTESKVSSAFSSDSDTWTASLKGDTGLASLGWALDASKLSTDYSNGRHTEADRYYGTLTWRLDPQFRLNFSGGTESNNYATLVKDSRTTHGYGFEWAPTPRTNVSVFRERRFFGNGHNISLTHRTALTAWKYSDVRDVMIMNQSGTVGLGTFYDLVYALSATAPGVDPNNPAMRAAWTNLFFLMNPGLSPTSIIPSNFLSSQASVQRQRELSFAITGVRNTVTFMATDVSRQALAVQSVALLGDSFQTSNVINQRGLSMNWSNRLSADSTLAATLMKMDTTGSSSGAGLKTTQNTLTVNLSTRVGPKTTASLGLRHTEFDSKTNPYTENALTGTLTARF